MENSTAQDPVSHTAPQQPIPEEVIFEWKALARPFKKRTREFYSTVGVIVLLLSVILFVAREFLLIGVILSLAFISYALGSVEPEEIVYKITNKGIRMAASFYPLQLLGRFWFEKKWGQEIAMVEHFGGFPTVLMLVIDKKDKKKVEETLTDYLIKQQPDPTAMDKMTTWLQEKVPLESE